MVTGPSGPSGPSAPSPWIKGVLAGVFVLRDVGGDEADRIVRQALSRYRGPELGGVDLMAPGPSREAWLLTGRWADCFDPDVQRGAQELFAGLVATVDLENAGVALGTGGKATLDAGRAFASLEGGHRVTVAPLHAYRGGIAVRWWDGTTRARIEGIFPSLPGFTGMHMGAPHWLGHGVRQDGTRLLSITPYIRLDFVPEAGVSLSAMCEEAEFARWLDALRAGTGWP